jgi:VanZ family protein
MNIDQLHKTKFMRNFPYWVPVLLWMVIIYWMSTATFSSNNTASIIGPIIRFFMPAISRKEFLVIHGIIRKLAHVTEYLIFGILLFRAFRAGAEERRTWQWVFSSLAVIVLFALSDEFHQSFLPMRTASLRDVCFDISGGFLAQCVSVLWYRRLHLMPGGHGEQGEPRRSRSAGGT